MDISFFSEVTFWSIDQSSSSFPSTLKCEFAWVQCGWSWQPVWHLAWQQVYLSALGFWGVSQHLHACTDESSASLCHLSQFTFMWNLGHASCPFQESVLEKVTRLLQNCVNMTERERESETVSTQPFDSGWKDLRHWTYILCSLCKVTHLATLLSGAH